MVHGVHNIGDPGLLLLCCCCCVHHHHHPNTNTVTRSRPLRCMYVWRLCPPVGLCVIRELILLLSCHMTCRKVLDDPAWPSSWSTRHNCSCPPRFFFFFFFCLFSSCTSEHFGQTGASNGCFSCTAPPSHTVVTFRAHSTYVYSRKQPACFCAWCCRRVHATDAVVLCCALRQPQPHSDLRRARRQGWHPVRLSVANARLASQGVLVSSGRVFAMVRRRCSVVHMHALEDFSFFQACVCLFDEQMFE